MLNFAIIYGGIQTWDLQVFYLTTYNYVTRLNGLGYPTTCVSPCFYFLITNGVCKTRKYCNRMSEKKKFSPFDKCSWFVCLRRQNKQKKCPSVCLSVCQSRCLHVWMYVRTWTFHVDTITFEGVSGSKQNLVGVFHVWNVGLAFKSKVISWSWPWSWFWTEFWSSQKLCGATPNLVDIFSI